MSTSGAGDIHARRGQESDFGRLLDADGERLGTVRAFGDRGFHASAGEGVVPLDELAATGRSGEAELVWLRGVWRNGVHRGGPWTVRLWCSRESTYYWTED
ncbi:hypothetical protein BRC90_03125 [Halobacteriales archaeon QS_4_69_34]|nr:MAG: hypothetical protein BRC90_03125 [Halobacteriales archaeon QS_4_69_34]